MMNYKYQLNTNGVNGTDLDQSDRATPGRQAVEGQAAVGRQPITDQDERKSKRHIWTRNENIKLMECLYKSQFPQKYGFMRRLHKIWLDEGGVEVSAQNLIDQKRSVLVHGLLSSTELSEIKQKVESSAVGSTSDNIDEDGSEEVERRAETEITTERIDQDVHGVRQKNDDADVMNDNVEICPESPTIDSDTEGGGSELRRLIIERMKSLPPVRIRLPALKNVQSMKMKKAVQEVNEVLKDIDTTDIEHTNTLIYATAWVISEKMGKKVVQVNTKAVKRKIPPWQRRLESKIKRYRQDLGKLGHYKERNEQVPVYHHLEKKYQVRRKGIAAVTEVLKQRIKVEATKVRQYKERNRQYRENQLFESSEARFYQSLDKDETGEIAPPDSNQSKEFWQNIWSQEKKHNGKAEWLNDITKECDKIERQNSIEIDEESLTAALRKTAAWKAPGPDGVQGYWLKSLTSLHPRIRNQLAYCLDRKSAPKWMTTGRTVLILKDPSKGNRVQNYRPITCLPLMWKILTSIFTDKIYKHLDANNVLVWEQKGCAKGSRGTKDHLLLDKAVMRDSRKRRTNLSMGWVDYKKAYDMVPHSWIGKVLDLLGVADNIRKFIQNSMEGWNVNLENNGKHLGNVDIRRGIFQGDSLSPLLFVMSMIPLSLLLRKVVPGYTFHDKMKVNHLLYMDDLKLYGKNRSQLNSLLETVRIYSEDIGMQFGLEKCAVIEMKRGKVSSSESMSVGGCEIGSLGGEHQYKYLGVWESDRVENALMKEKIEGEYFRRVRKILKTKLRAGNMMKAINTWAVTLFRYSAGVVHWTQEETERIDRKSRKLIKMYGGVHPRADVDRLYVRRKDGGRALKSVCDVIIEEEQSLWSYVAEKDNIYSNIKDYMKEFSQINVQRFRENRAKERANNWSEKVMNGQYERQTKEINRAEESWQWLKRGALKRETEALLVAAQDQALRTNYRKAKIEHSGTSPLCRMCKKKNETVDHLVSACEKMAQTEYKARHDRVATALHWSICKKIDTETTEQWYRHRADTVVENGKYKLLWDLDIQTRKVISARRPDIVLVNKEERTCFLIDVSVPGDTRVVEKEDEKKEKYADLAYEVKKLWELRSVIVIPIVIGALGCLSERHLSYLATLGVGVSFETLQKAALLGTARILRKVLDA